MLGEVGQTEAGVAPHVHFAIRPAGRGAPKIDPKPILDGWKLLEATAIYRAAGKNPFLGGASTGQVLLMSKSQLIRRVLADPALEIYSCGREDIRNGAIDRRILALMEYLVARGFRLTITSLTCGHGFYTASGNVSHHSSGNAIDIAQINGIPVIGNQGEGSITEALVRDVMQLQGSMEPDQIISLMDFGADNTFAMGDHDDHVHVGYTPLYGPNGGSASQQFTQILKGDQWQRLIDRLGEIENPTVPTSPSQYAIPTNKRKAEIAKPEGRQGQQAPTRFQRPHRRVGGTQRSIASRPWPARSASPSSSSISPAPSASRTGGISAASRSACSWSGSRAYPLPAAVACAGRSPQRPSREPGSETVPLTSLTAIRPEPLGDEDAAAAWLETLRDDQEAMEAVIADALLLINEAVHASRTATLDAHRADIDSEHALAVRIGFGAGDELADGRWEEAIEIPHGERRRRAEVLRPQERIAAVLGAREHVAACELLLLRARADVDAARTREAALQVRVGLEALLAERSAFATSGQQEDLAALDERRKLTGEAANEALLGELSDARAAEVVETLSLCERVLRRKRALG